MEICITRIYCQPWGLFWASCRECEIRRTAICIHRHPFISLRCIFLYFNCWRACRRSHENWTNFLWRASEASNQSAEVHWDRHEYPPFSSKQMSDMYSSTAQKVFWWSCQSGEGGGYSCLPALFVLWKCKKTKEQQTKFRCSIAFIFNEISRYTTAPPAFDCFIKKYSSNILIEQLKTSVVDTSHLLYVY